ncbi:MAG TPA: hypothetical protein VI756_13340 [Blastocatellia bacterium]
MAYYKLAPVLAFSIDPSVFWPYAAGAMILLIGLPVVLMGAARRAHGIDKLVAFGPLLFAIPMAIFGGDHFVGAKFVATIVPRWIPWHFFWTYFVGTALIVGALSLATTIQWRLAAGSFALMLLIFWLTIHLPNFLAFPRNPGVLTLLTREILLLAGCLAFAASPIREPASLSVRSGALLPAALGNKLVGASCVLLGITFGEFGIQHFLRPDTAPGYPQDNPAVQIPMPSWLPGHALWMYLVGSIFVLSAIGLITIRYAQTAAVLIGATVLVIIPIVYIPVTIARATDITGGLNYLAIHFAMAGSALMLASALPAHSPAPANVPDAEPARIERVANS